MLVVKNNLAKFFNFSKNVINLKIQIIIIICIKYSSNIPFVYNYLSMIFNIKNIPYEILFISNQSEINYFCEKFYKKKKCFFLFLLNFGNDVNLKYFSSFNYYFIKKIFVIDFNVWLFSRNLTLKYTCVFSNHLSIRRKYHLMSFEERKYFLNKIFPSSCFVTISSIFKLNFNFYDEMWTNIICTIVLRSLYLINRNMYKNIIFLVSKKISFLKEMKKNQFFKGESAEINLHIFKKKKSTPFFFIKFSSLNNTLLCTPFFFIKFRLWKYKGILKLFRFFFKSICYNEKNRLTLIKQKMKKIGIEFPIFNSFTKLYCFNFNFYLNKIFKISTNDFIYKVNINKNNFYENCVEFLDKKIAKLNLQYTKSSQKYLVKIIQTLLREKIYLSGLFFRYFFLKNIPNQDSKYEILRYISFYLMVVMNSKFLIKKALFAVWHTKELNYVVGSFPNARTCKKIREKNFIRQPVYANLDKFIQLKKCIHSPLLHDICN
nr:hypothetical protein CparaKRNrm2_p048 [Cryptomonas paramecium]